MSPHIENVLVFPDRFGTTAQLLRDPGPDQLPEDVGQGRRKTETRQLMLQKSVAVPQGIGQGRRRFNRGGDSTLERKRNLARNLLGPHRKVARLGAQDVARR